MLKVRTRIVSCYLLVYTGWYSANNNKNLSLLILFNEPHLKNEDLNVMQIMHYAGHVLDNTRPHQLCWGDREMGTAISCTECSQMAGLIWTG